VAILVQKLIPKPKEYDVFLSHHKVAAGCLTRELNLLFSNYCKGKVFIDSDHLQNLQDLLTTVEREVRCLLVLGTPEILTRPWCIAEIVTSARHNVPVVFCEVNGCVPDFEFDVDDMDTAMREFLTSLNIDPTEVRDAFLLLKSAPRVKYSSYAVGGERAKELSEMLGATQTVGPNSVATEQPYLHPSACNADVPIIVATSARIVEAIATARILVHFFRERQIPSWIYDKATQDRFSGNAVDTTVQTLSTYASTFNLHESGFKVVVILTGDFYDDPATLALIVIAARLKVVVFGVTAENFGFQFLPEDRRDKTLRKVMPRVRTHVVSLLDSESPEAMRQHVTADELIEAVARMFKAIALPLTQNSGSKRLMEAQVEVDRHRCRLS
jgi:hypothetical protein